MHVNIIIPTYNRPVLLMETIHSIKHNSYKDVSIFVVVDGNREILDKILLEKVAVLFNPERRDWIYSINRGISYAISDAVMYAADDLVFKKDCLEKAVRAMEEKFPDGNGLIAINQTVGGITSAFGLMGRKFIEHFPARRVFCPEFIHYSSDSEIGLYARNNNLFHYCEDAIMDHKRLKDDTWRKANEIKNKDYETRVLRRGRGLIWGDSFELVTEKGVYD